MRLIELKITSDFKNLKGLKVSFNPKNNTYVIIGNNGSGKSSILEAISSIFSSLWYGNPTYPEFTYYLKYEKDGHQILIITAPGNKMVCKVDGAKTTIDSIRDKHLPNKLICNYSGEDFRIRDKYYQKHFVDYVDGLKKSTSSEVLRMVFVDKEMWKIMLLIMMACQDRVDSFKKFLKETLRFERLSTLSVRFDEKQLMAWVDNPVKYYINRINEQVKAGALSIASINPSDSEARDLFVYWMSAIPLIERMTIVYNDGIDADYLSEGEKKMMSVLFIQEAIADEDSLILLDEPDSHIHVARKEELKDVLTSAENRETILTSHSPTLTAKFPEKSIIMLDRNIDGKAEVIKAEKQEIVAKLTNGLWTIQEQNIFLASHKDILVVEGKTDETYLSKALESFHKAGAFINQEYSYLPSGGAAGVELMLDHFTPKKNQLVVALFDSDDSGWKAINKIFGKVGDDAYNSGSFQKARKFKGIWFAVYPDYHKRKVQNFNIEDYFPHYVFLRHVMSFRSLSGIISKDALKRGLALDCENNKIKDKHYKNFEHLFNMLEEIKTADAAGWDVLS